jgi:hypothetical protein
MTDKTARRPRWPWWRLIAPIAVALALAALLVPVFQRPPSADDRARFDRIEDGMTERQVEEVLGGPRGVYDRTRRPWPGLTATSFPGSNSSHRSWWYFSDCTVEVDFDDDHRVTGKRIEPLPPQSLRERAVRWWQ